MTPGRGDRRLRPDRPQARGGARRRAAGRVRRSRSRARRGAGPDRAGRRRHRRLARRPSAAPTSTSSSSRRPTSRCAEIARAAVEAGKHVLVEKPAARSVAEIDPVIEAAAARAPRWCASASITATIRRCARRASCSTRGALGDADVRARPLRPRRPRRLRQGVARRSRRSPAAAS